MEYRFLISLTCLLFLLSCKDNVSYELPEYELNLSVIKSDVGQVYILLSEAGDINLQDVSVQHNDSLLPHRQYFLNDEIRDWFHLNDLFTDQFNTITVVYDGKSATFKYSLSELTSTIIQNTAPDTLINNNRIYMAGSPYTLELNNEGKPDYHVVRIFYEKRVGEEFKIIEDEFFVTSNSVEVPADFARSGVWIDVTSYWGPFPTEIQYEKIDELPINFRQSTNTIERYRFLDSSRW